MHKPTSAELAAAKAKRIPDLLRADLEVVFCGINPGLYSAAVGHNFARPGNRFWPALFAAGFTPRLFTGFDDHELLELGCGMTNIVSRASARAEELTTEELRRGARSLRRKILKYRPRYLAVVGIGAFRSAFKKPAAVIGPQPDPIGDTTVWLLPNTSGLNANHRPAQLAELFEQLRIAAGL
ncbi:MAG TPA: G/U mismatch-specific DNA glycosylase [Kofleriaceae bacterium]